MLIEVCQSGKSLHEFRPAVVNIGRRSEPKRWFRQLNLPSYVEEVFERVGDAEAELMASPQPKQHRNILPHFADERGLCLRAKFRLADGPIHAPQLIH